ncbi:hypothetical protein [Modestobacter sp. NPDC049651]|uniref:hypothetical protein n=1 Tax=unclassified Modestobacter TaxID=2643866 RepID=UPI0033D5BC8B
MAVVRTTFQPEQTVVRAGSLWWVMTAITGVAGAVIGAWCIVQPADLATRLIGPVWLPTLAAVCLAVSTERWSTSGRTLVGVGLFSVWTVGADDVVGVDDENGLQVVLRSGRRLEFAICQPSLAQSIIRNRRRRREAARLREWLESVRGPAPLGWAQADVAVRVRWSAVVGVVATAALGEAAALLSWALA